MHFSQKDGRGQRPFFLGLIWVLTVAVAFWLGRSTAIDRNQPVIADSVTPHFEEPEPTADGGATPYGVAVSHPEEESPLEEEMSLGQWQTQIADVLNNPNPKSLEDLSILIREIDDPEVLVSLLGMLNDFPRSSSRDRVSWAIWYRIGEIAPEQGLKLVEELNQADRRMAGVILSAGWARADAVGAWHHVRERLEQSGQNYDRYLMSESHAVLRTVIDSGRQDQAIAFAAELPANSTSEGILSSLAWMIGKYEPEAVLDLVDSLQVPELKEGTLRGFTLAWTEQDPAAAADWIVSRESDLGYGISRHVADEWIRSAGPKAVSEWVMASTETGNPERIEPYVASLAAYYASEDDTLAKSWIARIPEGENRDKAIARIAHDIRPGDKELALEWALTIESETKRQETAESILKSWQEESPEAAAVYLKEHPDVASTIESPDESP